MHDTEPMAAARPPDLPAATVRAERRISPAAAFGAGFALAFLVACVWLHVELAALRADVRAAHQAAASAGYAADRLAADARRFESERASSDGSAADAPTVTEDAAPEATERTPERPRVATRARFADGVRLRLHEMRAMLRRLRALWSQPGPTGVPPA